MSKKYLVILLTLAMLTPLFADIVMTQNFDGITPPNMPSGWIVRDYNSDTKTWATTTSHPNSTPNCIRYNYSRTNAAKDWFFTGPVTLAPGIPYTVGFFYRGSNASFPERLRIWVTTSQDSWTKYGSYIYDNNNIINTIYQSDLSSDFTVGTVGTYYIGFQCYSAADMWNLRIDDITVYKDVRDVGIDTIYTPLPGSYTFGSILTPKFLVRNYGQNTGGEYVPVHCAFIRYTPTAETLYRYDTMIRVEICNPETLTFPTWSPQLPCNHKFVAWTSLNGDQVPSNDKKEVSFTVDFRDVRPLSFTIPHDTMQYCTESIPTVVVKNEGHQTESFWTYFKSLNNLQQQEYLDSAYVTSLASGQQTTVTFTKWHFPVCNHTAIVWTALAGDENRHNDTITKPYTIYKIDAEITHLIVSDTVTSGIPFSAWVTVHNNGQHYILQPGWKVHIVITDTLTAIVEHESVFVNVPLAYCETTRVYFASLLIPNPCRHLLQAYLVYPGDQFPANNTLYRDIFAKRIDAEVTAIIAPDTVSTADSFNITIKAHNAGYHNILQPGWYLHFNIMAGVPDPTAFESLYVPVPLAPCETASVTIRRRIPDPCLHTITAWTAYPNDANPSNDMKSKVIRVKYIDAHPVAIIAPDTVNVIDSFNITVKVHNAGQHNILQPGWWVVVAVGFDKQTRYDSMQVMVPLAPCETTALTFRWRIPDPCYHWIDVWTHYPGDQNPANDHLGQGIIARNYDFEVVTILNMPDTAQVCNTYYPRVVVHNNGSHTGPQSATVFMNVYRNGNLVNSYQMASRMLIPCQCDTIEFPWHADSACNHMLKAWVVATDYNPLNDTFWKNFVVKYIDAHPVAIVAPDTVQVCDSFNVTIRVHNAGYHNILQPGWWVRYIVGAVTDIGVGPGPGPLYDSIQVNVPLAPCETANLTFRTHITEPCVHMIDVWTVYPGDQNPANDHMSKMIIARFTDAEVTAITAPDTVQVCNPFGVTVKVHNNGQHTTLQPGWYTHIMIDMARDGKSVIHESLPVTVPLAYCETTSVYFEDIHIFEPCDHIITAWTALAGDQNRHNDTLIRPIVAKWYDLGISYFSVTPDTIEYCNTVMCSVQVTNNSVHTGPINGYVQIKIYRNGIYTNTNASFGWPNIPPGETRTGIFTFHPESACNYQAVAICTTLVDQNRHNDTATANFVVTYHDVELVGITNVPDSIDVGATIHPKIVVHNKGIHVPEQSGWVVYNVLRSHSGPVDASDNAYYPVFTDSVWKTLAYCVYDTVEFDWTADSACWHKVVATVRFDPDQNLTNNTREKDFIVRYRDVEAYSVLVPGDTVRSCSTYIPVVVVNNNGVHVGPELCTLSVKIWRYQMKMDSLCHISMDTTQPIMVYDTWIIVTVNPGSDTFNMPSWHPMWSDVYWVGAHHVIQVSVHMAADQNPSNDTIIDNFIVKARRYDLQVNYVGLLKSNTVVTNDTVSVGVSYNPVSVVSNSPAGPAASFRSWLKIIRVKTNSVVYSRYLDRTLQPGQYACLYYQSGWVPSDSGLYLERTYLEFRPGVDSIAINNTMERYWFAQLTSKEADDNTEANPTALPRTFALQQNYPNPIFATTIIKWQIPVESKVRISVYDATGRIIKTLINNNYEPGYYNTMWDCTDNANQKVSAGIYFYEMQATNFSTRYKMVIARQN